MGKGQEDIEFQPFHRVDRIQCLGEAIATLPERLQLVVQLYFVEELNLAEIATTLGVSIPRVHQLKTQAIERLRLALEGIAEVL